MLTIEILERSDLEVIAEALEDYTGQKDYIWERATRAIEHALDQSHQAGRPQWVGITERGRLGP